MITIKSGDSVKVKNIYFFLFSISIANIAYIKAAILEKTIN